MIDHKNYILFIREKPCLVCGSPADPHHVRTIGIGRDRNKKLIEHFTLVPLCQEHHSQLHTIGERKFCNKHMLDLWKSAHLFLLEFLQDSNIVTCV